MEVVLCRLQGSDPFTYLLSLLSKLKFVRLFWWKILHVFVVLGVMVEGAIEYIAQANEANTYTYNFLLLQLDLLILGLLEYFSGQKLSSSNQANAMVYLK